jgi:hypothetical protein
MITKFEKRQKSSVLSGNTSNLFFAEVEIGDNILTFSQLENETEWYCDSRFGRKNMYPYFCHGEGSRSCLKQMAQGELKNELEKKKAEFIEKAS